MPETTFDLSNLKITPTLKSWLVETLDCPSTWTDDSLYIEQIAKSYGDLSSEQQKALKLLVFDQISQGDEMPDPNKVFGSGNGNIDVKEPSQQYSQERYEIKGKTGERIFDPVHRKFCESSSQADMAKLGCLYKHLANKSGLVHNPLNEHEQELLSELAEKDTWAGKIGNEWYDEVTPHRNIKALIDDNTSGGLEIAPIVADEQIVQYPLLHGELFPQIDLRPIGRGRRVEGSSISNVDVGWGTGDNSSISLFDTDSLVSAVDTTIFPVTFACEIGLDLMSDSVVDIGTVLTGLVAQRLLAELDRVIAVGNGSTEPEGLTNASAGTTINTDNGASGSLTLLLPKETSCF